VSSHVGIDDTVNTVGEYVTRDMKAWTAADANPVAVQAELCTPSGASDNWTAADWNSHPNMLANCAAWIAEEAAHFNIPIVKLSPAQAQGGGRGVCQHADLGAWGGGHHDCGTGFPIDAVLALAGGVTPPAPGPPPAPAPPPPPAGKAPPFPYPSSDYLGQPSPDPHCHSGYYGGVDNANVKTFQTQLLARGWSGIGTADGMYGPQTENIVREFQQDSTAHGWPLDVDGLAGSETWRASWERPIS
jgi:hypothetical protein